MDTMGTVTTSRPEPPPARRISRAMLTAALACFTLPFLTVTCYGDDVTLSGVQAATTIDITRQAEPDPGDRQFAQEGEPPNLFAIVALAATATGLTLSLRKSARRRAIVWAAALGGIALVGAYLYAFQRTWGEAFPDIGLAAAITLLVAAAWAGVGRVPIWIRGAAVLVGVATIPYSLLATQTQLAYGPWYALFYGGSIGAIALAVGAMRAPAHARPVSVERPAIARVLVAAIPAAVFLGASAVGLFSVARAFSPDEPNIGSSYAFAFVGLAVFVGMSVLSWSAGRAIARPRRRAAVAIGAPVVQR
jgi:hypothetical protein